MDYGAGAELAWRSACELAWEAFGAGTIPVGAVVTAADGVILSRGRNRINDQAAPAGQIFGSRVAHAEINALVQLGMSRRYHDCTLWTTLEPCAQCVGAAWISTIGTVRFAAQDLYGGAAGMIERHVAESDRSRSFPMPVEGPLGGPLGLFAEVLPVAHFLDRHPAHHVTDTYRRRQPHLIELATQLRLQEHASRSLDEVLGRVWDRLSQTRAG